MNVKLLLRLAEAVEENSRLLRAMMEKQAPAAALPNSAAGATHHRFANKIKTNAKKNIAIARQMLVRDMASILPYLN